MKPHSSTLFKQNRSLSDGEQLRRSRQEMGVRAKGREEDTACGSTYSVCYLLESRQIKHHLQKHKYALMFDRLRHPKNTSRSSFFFLQMWFQVANHFTTNILCRDNVSQSELWYSQIQTPVVGLFN